MNRPQRSIIITCIKALSKQNLRHKDIAKLFNTINLLDTEWSEKKITTMLWFNKNRSLESKKRLKND